jgi:hypothetical protein
MDRNQVSNLAAAAASADISDEVKLFVLSIVLTVLGAFSVLDLFGIVTRYRVPRSERSIERQRRWGLPDTPKVVGVVFLGVGVAGLIFSLFIVVVILVRFSLRASS